MKLFLRNQLYRSITLARMLNISGSYIYNIVFIIYAASMEQAPHYIFIANMTTLVPMLFTFWIGVKADQTKQKGKWMIRVGFIQAAIFTSIAFLIRDRNFLVFSLVCLGNILSDLGSDYASGLRLPILQKNLEKDELFEAYSFSQFILYISSIAGQGLGIWLLTVSHHNYSFVALNNAATFVLSSIIYWKNKQLLTHDQPKPQKEKIHLLKQLKELWATLQLLFYKSEESSFLAIVITVLLTNLLGASLTPIYNLYLLDSSFWTLTYGQGILLIEIVSLVGAIAGSLWTNDGLSKFSILHLLMLDSLLFMVLGFSHLVELSPLLALLAIFGSSYLTGKIGPKLDSLLMAELPSDILAQSDSLISLLFSLAIPVGTILFSSLASNHIFLCWLVFMMIGMSALLIPILARLKKR